MGCNAARKQVFKIPLLYNEPEGASVCYWLHIGDNPKKVSNCNTFWPLGKDEVASSNLASSSKKSVIPIGMADFLLFCSYLNWRPHPLLPKANFNREVVRAPTKPASWEDGSQFKSGNRGERRRAPQQEYSSKPLKHLALQRLFLFSGRLLGKL